MVPKSMFLLWNNFPVWQQVPDKGWNWMAPELLLGQSLKKPCDIYAFAMTLYEVSSTLLVLKVMVLTHLLVRYLQMRFHWVISAMLILLSLWSGRMSDLKGQMMRMLPIYQMKAGNLLKNVGWRNLNTGQLSALCATPSLIYMMSLPLCHLHLFHHFHSWLFKPIHLAHWPSH